MYQASNTSIPIELFDDNLAARRRWPCPELPAPIRDLVSNIVSGSHYNAFMSKFVVQGIAMIEQLDGKYAKL